MLLTVNASRFSLVNGGHEMTTSALKSKYVAHRLAILAQIMMSLAHSGTQGAQRVVLIAQ
jgi:hypothetical protein